MSVSNKRFAIALSVLATAVCVMPASAGSFTGTYKGSPPKSIIVPPTATSPASGGSTFSSTVETTFSDGTKAKATSTCISWLTPGKGTTNDAVCEAAEVANPNNKFISSQTCLATAPADPTKPAHCWFFMRGTSGKYAGKTGQGSLYGTQAQGTFQGAWNN